MQAAVRFHITRHFAQRAAERNLSVEEIKEAVRRPTRRRKLKADGDGGILYRFERIGRDGALVVIANLRRDEARLVTAYHESGT